MTLEQAIQLCRATSAIDDVLYGLTRYPVLPWWYNYLAEYRVYVTMFDSTKRLWHDLNLNAKEPYESLLNKVDTTIASGLNPISHLVNDGVNSTRWQALTWDELYELNLGEWKDIPHVRG